MSYNLGDNILYKQKPCFDLFNPITALSSVSLSKTHRNLQVTATHCVGLVSDM